jgi:two-component sensor histidine kinase
MSGEDVQLPPDPALGLGLILHELASNAVKYGAFSNPRGRVDLTWNITGNGARRIELTWKESGGPLVAATIEPGFGVRLIQRGLDKVLDSTVSLTFPEEGAEARISLPLAERTPA